MGLKEIRTKKYITVSCAHKIKNKRIGVRDVEYSANYLNVNVFPNEETKVVQHQSSGFIALYSKCKLFENLKFGHPFNSMNIETCQIPDHNCNLEVGCNKQLKYLSLNDALCTNHDNSLNLAHVSSSEESLIRVSDSQRRIFPTLGPNDWQLQ